jgi:hypothetical protein
MWRLLYIIGLSLAVEACAAPPHAQTRATEPIPDIAELWREPVDLLQRDLIAGPGGAALAPRSDAPYEFVSFKTSGTNPGYTLRDASGRIWSVKLGIEAQSEVTTSRILWALGYHQPATYYVAEFSFDGPGPLGGRNQQARFRTEVDPWRPGDVWSWYENPFVNTQPFRGLVVTQLILNAWDLKTPNNRIYNATDSSMRPNRQFIVRDVGASLGEARQFALFNRLGTRGLQGSKNNIDDFERQGFITSVNGSDVTFDYRGVNAPLIDTITAADVIWACEQFARIPDGHWRAAFQAGGYAPDVAERYIKKIKSKVAQGLALKRPGT